MQIDGVSEIIADLDDDFLDNLIEDLSNHISHIERYMMDYPLVFSGSDDSNEITAEMLSHIKSVNMICQQTFLEPLHAFMQIIEDFFYDVCTGRYGQSQWLSELMMLLVDEVRAAFDELKLNRALDVQLLNDFRGHIKSLMGHKGDEYDEKIKFAISTFSCKVHPDLIFSALETDEVIGSHTEENNKQPVSINSNRLLSSGLKLFEDLAQTLDARSVLWEGRAAFILQTGLLINNNLPFKVDEIQLTGAIYMHDVSMALLPDSFLFKEAKYSSEDIMLLQQHPIQTFELMQLMPDWQEAAEMVHQHHERFDGEGYPNAISGSAIQLGASIIAVADAFYSLTHNRSDRGFKKSLRRAIAEINKCNGTQFSPIVVEAFNAFLVAKS